MFSKDKREREPEVAVATSPVKTQRPANRNAPPSIISSSLRIVGNLVSDGDIQVDGTVDGDVQSRSLTISQGAAVNGAISSDSVRVDGAVNGQIKAANVLLGPTAHVMGDIIHASLVVEAGAFVEGHVRRKEPEPAAILMPGTSAGVKDAKDEKPATKDDKAPAFSAAG
jgi:cytoskeletal protein CcmA (bactofilin family)